MAIGERPQVLASNHVHSVHKLAIFKFEVRITAGILLTVNWHSLFVLLLHVFALCGISLNLEQRRSPTKKSSSAKIAGKESPGHFVGALCQLGTVWQARFNLRLFEFKLSALQPLKLFRERENNQFCLPIDYSLPVVGSLLLGRRLHVCVLRTVLSSSLRHFYGLWESLTNGRPL